MLPRVPRWRTGTAEMAPFWRALYLYRHDIWDRDVQAAEWSGLGLDWETLRALKRAGFSCYRAVPPCPTWLLGTIPDLGPTRIAALRRILPYDRDIYSGPICPGRVIENAVAIQKLTPVGLDEYLAEQARREQAGEPPLIPTNAALAGLLDPDPDGG